MIAIELVLICKKLKINAQRKNIMWTHCTYWLSLKYLWYAVPETFVFILLLNDYKSRNNLFEMTYICLPARFETFWPLNDLIFGCLVEQDMSFHTHHNLYSAWVVVWNSIWPIIYWYQVRNVVLSHSGVVFALWAGSESRWKVHGLLRGFTKCSLVTLS